MPNNAMNSLAASIKNLLEAAVQNNVAGAEALVAALDTAVAASRVADNSGCACTTACSSGSKYNKLRTLHKSYATAGFTDKTLKVVVRSKNDHDEIVISGANDYREPLFEVVEFPRRIDRASLKAQLRLGVLKVTGRTYKSNVALSDMNLTQVELPITMKA